VASTSSPDRPEAQLGAHGHGKELFELAVRQRQQRAGEQQGERLLPAAVAERADAERAGGVVEGEVPRAEPGGPLALADQAAGPAQRHGDFEQVRGGGADQLRSPARLEVRAAQEVDLDGAEVDAAHVEPEVGRVLRADLHGHPGLGRQLTPEVEALGREEIVSPNQRFHRNPVPVGWTVHRPGTAWRT